MLQRSVHAVVVALLITGEAALSQTTTPSTGCARRDVGKRRSHALAYDGLSGRVVMFGGRSDDSTDYDPRSLWSWDGERWTCVHADGPPARRDAFLIFDAARRRLVLFGGRQFSGNTMSFFRDTWEWDGREWTLRDTLGPAPRIHGAATYDPARRAIVIHGGAGARSRLTDMWSWNGHRWQQIPARFPDGAMGDAVFASPRGLTILVGLQDTTRGCAGGFRAHMRELRGDSLVSVGPIGPCFSPMAPAAGPADGFLVFFGWNPDEPAASWVWNGASWRKTDSGPSRRIGTHAAYDERRRRVVLFGGNDEQGMLGDTWEWDGQRWSRR
jgi:hypothetical protein